MISDGITSCIWSLKTTNTSSIMELHFDSFNSQKYKHSRKSGLYISMAHSISENSGYKINKSPNKSHLYRKMLAAVEQFYFDTV